MLSCVVLFRAVLRFGVLCFVACCLICVDVLRYVCLLCVL